MLAKLITAMTREGKFKDAIQDRIGATVDTSDLEKQLSVLNANLHQAETIKTRLEQQMDNLDVTDIHYDKKISDLQRRLDIQYDKIDEVEETIADLKSQVYELKKNQIDADSIYGFLNAFNELYAECTDAEKKQFMQAFIERIDIFPERREDGNWIRNIRFQFPVPILRDGKEVVRVDGISLDKEKSDEHTVTLEKFPTLETVVLLSYKKPDGHINVKVEFGEGEGKVPLDNIAKRAEEYKPKERVTYKMIKEYIEAKYGFKVHTAYIAEVKRDLGLPMYDAPNAVEELKQPRKHPTVEKVESIKAMYPLVKDEDIRIMISEMNNTSVKWNKGDFAKQACAAYPDNAILGFIVKYMNIQHQRTKKGEVDDMLPNGGFKLTTLSKYLIYSADIKESVLADTCKYGEGTLTKYVGNEPEKMVERAEKIIKAGLDAGFTYRFLAKGFFIDWIANKNNLGIQYTELLERLKDVNREVVDSIMREAQKHNFMEQLNRIG